MTGHYVHARHSLFYDAYYADIFAIDYCSEIGNGKKGGNCSLKLENVVRKTNYLEENENFTTTVITYFRYFRSAIKFLFYFYCTFFTV